MSLFHAHEIKELYKMIEELYSYSTKQQNDTMRHDSDISQLLVMVGALNAEVSKLKNDMASFKLPPSARLSQLKNGIDILAQFANELQRDIEAEL